MFSQLGEMLLLLIFFQVHSQLKFSKFFDCFGRDFKLLQKVRFLYRFRSLVIFRSCKIGIATFARLFFLPRQTFRAEIGEAPMNDFFLFAIFVIFVKKETKEYRQFSVQKDHGFCFFCNLLSCLPINFFIDA